MVETGVMVDKVYMCLAPYYGKNGLDFGINFNGPIGKAIPELLDRNLSLMNIPEIMFQIAKSGFGRTDNLGYYWRKYYSGAYCSTSAGFPSKDGIVTDKKGGIKLNPNSMNLQDRIDESYDELGGVLNLESPINTGVTRFKDLPEESEDGFQLYFSEEDVYRYCNRRFYTLQKILENPVWISLVRGDKDLLEYFVKSSCSMEETENSIGQSRNGFMISILEPREYEFESFITLKPDIAGSNLEFSNLISNFGIFPSRDPLPFDPKLLK